MFAKLKTLFSEKTPPVNVQKVWRTGMWVMCGDRIGVLFSVGDPCEVHYTDQITGENVESVRVPMNALRQARYPEIPVRRRMIDAAKALELGYGP